MQGQRTGQVSSGKAIPLNQRNLTMFSLLETARSVFGAAYLKTELMGLLTPRPIQTLFVRGTKDSRWRPIVDVLSTGERIDKLIPYKTSETADLPRLMSAL